MSTLPFTNFTKGELAPELQARIDTNQYSAGAKKVRNFIIQKYGGLSFRPGFRLVGAVDDSSEAIRYIPFQYNIEQAYIMSLEDGRMRLLAGGGFISEDNLVITAITNATNAQVTAAYHGYAVGDRLFFNGVTGMPALNNQTGKVLSVIDADNFTVDINTTTYGAFVSSTGTARVAAPTPPPADPPPPTPAPPSPEPPATTDSGGSGQDLGGFTPGINGGGGFDEYRVVNV